MWFKLSGEVCSVLHSGWDLNFSRASSLHVSILSHEAEITFAKLGCCPKPCLAALSQTEEAPAAAVPAAAWPRALPMLDRQCWQELGWAAGPGDATSPPSKLFC